MRMKPVSSAAGSGLRAAPGAVAGDGCREIGSHLTGAVASARLDGSGHRQAALLRAPVVSEAG
jgi:hypothetical protein